MKQPMDEPPITIQVDAIFPLDLEEFWTDLEIQLEGFHEVIFYARPETFEEAVGNKVSTGKFISTAPRMEEPESESKMLHGGIIPFTSQSDVEFIDLALPLMEKQFHRVKDLITKRQWTTELLVLWGQLSYYCGRIESYWTLAPEKVSHRRGGKSNGESASIEAQKVWYSQMILLRRASVSDRGTIDRDIIKEIRFRQVNGQDSDFNANWFERFFNDNDDLTNAFTSKKLYKSVFEELAKNSNRLNIPDVSFLSTLAIAREVNRT